MVTITFHGCVNEIGGNKIFIEDGAKEFLDFGKNHSREDIVAYSGGIRMHVATKGMFDDIIEKAPKRKQSTSNLCALCVLCGGISMFPKRATGHYTKGN